MCLKVLACTTEPVSHSRSQTGQEYQKLQYRQRPHVLAPCGEAVIATLHHNNLDLDFVTTPGSGAPEPEPNLLIMFVPFGQLFNGNVSQINNIGVLFEKVVFHFLLSMCVCANQAS